MNASEEYAELRRRAVIQTSPPPDVEIVNAVVGSLKAENARLRQALTAAHNALLSYQYGNGSPDLAAEVAEFVEKALKGEGK